MSREKKTHQMAHTTICYQLEHKFSHCVIFLSVSMLDSHSFFFFSIVKRKKKDTNAFYYVTILLVSLFRPMISICLGTFSLPSFKIRYILMWVMCASLICQLCSTFYYIIFNWTFYSFQTLSIVCFCCST